MPQRAKLKQNNKNNRELTSVQYTSTKPGEVFDSRKCDEITVIGAGKQSVNGIYVRSTSNLPNGGVKAFPYYFGLINFCYRHRLSEFSWKSQSICPIKN